MNQKVSFAPSKTKALQPNDPDKIDDIVYSDFQYINRKSKR